MSGAGPVSNGWRLRSQSHRESNVILLETDGQSWGFDNTTREHDNRDHLARPNSRSDRPFSRPLWSRWTVQICPFLFLPWQCRTRTSIKEAASSTLVLLSFFNQRKHFSMLDASWLMWPCSYKSLHQFFTSTELFSHAQHCVLGFCQVYGHSPSQRIWISL